MKSEIAPETAKKKSLIYNALKNVQTAIENPLPDPDVRDTRQKLEGEIPSQANPPPGCKFQTRCPYAVDHCREEEPALEIVEGEHTVACHRWRELEAAALPGAQATA